MLCTTLLHWSGTLFIGEATAVAAVVMVHCSRCSAAAGVSLCTRVAFSCTDSFLQNYFALNLFDGCGVFLGRPRRSPGLSNFSWSAGLVVWAELAHSPLAPREACSAPAW